MSSAPRSGRTQCRQATAPAPPTPAGTRWLFHAVMTPSRCSGCADRLRDLHRGPQSFDDIAANGLGSLPQSFTLDDFRQAWVDGGRAGRLINSLLVTVPPWCWSLCWPRWPPSRSAATRSRCARTILLLMLGRQPAATADPAHPGRPRSASCSASYDTLCALIGVQVGFGLGFYIFVLHGFMRAMPGEIQRGGDASTAPATWQIYRRIIMPLARPALAALARAGLHLDLQRPALGDHRAAHGDQDAHHGRAAQPAGRIRQLVERRRRRSADRGDPHRYRVLRLPEALRLRPAGRSEQVAERAGFRVRSNARRARATL